MRRLPVLLLAAALTTPVTTLLPTLRLPSAHPVPVAPAVSTIRVTGVDGPSQAAADHGNAAVRAAQGSSDAVAPLAGLAGRVRAADATGGGPRTVVLTAPRRTAPFSSLGVTWDLTPTTAGPAAVPDVVVVARTHGSAGWSAWNALDTDEAELSDPGSHVAQRAGTSPLWVGASDGVQLRIDLITGPAPTNVRLELIDPGSSPFDLQVGATPPGTAAAQAALPTVHPRAEWGADESRVRSAATLMPGISAAVIHHTTDTNTYSAAQVPAIIRADYAYHLSRGWNDIGYNFLVDRFGRIWEGRRGGIDQAVQGAHAGGFNFRTLGIAMIGNSETATPTPAAVTAIERLIAWRLDLARIDPLGTTVLTAQAYASARWPAGTAVRLPVIMGHRDVGYTACPGARLYRLLAQIRNGVSALIGAALVTPGSSASSGGYGADGPTVSARVLAAQTWRLSVSDCAGTAFAGQNGSTPARRVAVAHWDARRGGASARPGLYGLSLSSQTATSTARPLSWNYLVGAPAPGPAPVGDVARGSGGLVPVTPVRLLDSTTGPVLPTGPGGRVDLAVTGRGGVPATQVPAVALQVTALCPSAATSLVVWPAGQPRPAAATVQLPARGARTAIVVVPVGAQGQVSLGNAAGVTGLLVDVVGYTATGASPIAAVPSTRVLSSSAGPLPSGSSRTVTLPTIAGVSPGLIDAVLVQVRLRGASAAGSVQLTGQGQPATGLPTARYEAGADTVTLAVVRPGQGALVVTNTGVAVTVVLDVIGVAAPGVTGGGQLTAVSASRVYDSRTAGAGGALAAGASRQVALTRGNSPVPADARAVLVDLSATAGSATATATLRATGDVPPARADLALARGGGNTNLVLVPLAQDGTVTIGTDGGLGSFALDVVGYLR
jgi:hypothetical protein